MRAALPIAVLALVAGCVAPPRPAPVVPAAPVTAPTPVPLAADWRDWPLTPGAWRYAATPNGTEAVFGTPAMLALRCDRASRTVTFLLAAAAPVAVTIRTSSMTRALALQPVAEGAAAALVPADPLLDAIGFSRGRFTVERAGMPPLVIPAWAEIERVTEDCRG